jgi:hypothetical protein
MVEADRRSIGVREARRVEHLLRCKELSSICFVARRVSEWVSGWLGRGEEVREKIYHHAPRIVVAGHRLPWRYTHHLTGLGHACRLTNTGIAIGSEGVGV